VVPKWINVLEEAVGYGTIAKAAVRGQLETRRHVRYMPPP